MYWIAETRANATCQPDLPETRSQTGFRVFVVKRARQIRQLECGRRPGETRFGEGIWGVSASTCMVLPRGLATASGTSLRPCAIPPGLRSADGPRRSAFAPESSDPQNRTVSNGKANGFQRQSERFPTAKRTVSNGKANGLRTVCERFLAEGARRTYAARGVCVTSRRQRCSNVSAALR